LNDLTNIQVKDDLTKTFGNGASIIPGSISVNVDPGFTVNPFYTGTGATIDLLNAATSTLPKGTTRSINIMVRVDTRTASSTAFENTAIGSALGSGGIVLTDSSAEGENPDPNNDLDPSNDSDPTPIVLNNIPGIAMIGVALSVEDTTRKSDGSYNIAYKAILKNFGSSTLTNVQLVDSLSKVFSLQTGATFKKVGTPIASDISELAVNPDFDGVNDYELLIGGNSKLNPGVSDTLRFTINVSTDGRNTPYLNRVYAFAKAGNVVVTDISTNGLLPDLNGNNDPSEASEAEPTPVIIPGGIELFIPEGFSPNGDGINDVFVIRNAGGQQVTLEIYNRWMTLVYKNNDYKNDWDGTVNNGLRVGSTSQGLPDGTYFYVVKLENGRQYVRFLTITR
jgi:gliding motility-associated-like protein